MIKTMKIGDYREYQRVITQADVEQFGTVSGDLNPAHFDEAYTQKTIFKRPIVHGMLVGSLFSKIFGMEFPGEGTIYCSQNLIFLKPVYPGVMLRVKVTIKSINLEKNRVVFTTEIFNQEDQCALTGEAMLMPRKEKQDG